jgi:hypothetical protein
MRFCYFGAAALLFVFSSSVYGQSTDDFLGGAVTRTVLDEFGQPVVRADVCTVEGKRSDLSIFLPCSDWRHGAVRSPPTTL